MSIFCNVILKQLFPRRQRWIFLDIHLFYIFCIHWMFLSHYEPTHMLWFVSVLYWHLDLLVSCFSFMVKFEDSLFISTFIVSRCYIYWVQLYFLGLLVGVLSSSSCLFSMFAELLVFPVSCFALSLLQSFVCIWIQSLLVPKCTLVPLNEPFVHLLNV